MRLLNAESMELESFPDPVPENVPYAILSHTWDAEEVTFTDMQDIGVASTKPGFIKILSACQKTLDHGFRYIWIDTCCIDKSSSAELSEAINRMFRWYQDSTVCLTFLADFPRNADVEAQLPLCRWFTRGWTLQELIAPKNLLFLDQEWNLIGDKYDLGEKVEAITGISRWILDGSSPLSSVPLGQRMSWAAKRNTTREEDKAYCLLGIFDVNMPMMYGEESRAFIRLQEEILRRTSDLSIFAWQSDNTSIQYRGILAQSPAEFAYCTQIELNDDQFHFRDEISLTNRGVKIQTPLQYLGDGIYIMDLHCYRESKRLGIYLRRTQDTYMRSLPHETAQARPTGTAVTLPAPTIYLLSTVDEQTSLSILSSNTSGRSIYIQLPRGNPSFRIHSVRAVPGTYWEAHDHRFSIGSLRNFVCFVRFSVTLTPSPGWTQHLHVRSEEDTASFILVCDLAGKSQARLSLYAQTGLQSSPKPERFIDPFTNIEGYGPLGDAFSLDLLRPGPVEDRRVRMIHRDPRSNYVITAAFVNPIDPPPSVFRVLVSIFPDDNDTDLGFRGLGGPVAPHDVLPLGGQARMALSTPAAP